MCTLQMPSHCFKVNKIKLGRELKLSCAELSCLFAYDKALDKFLRLSLLEGEGGAGATASPPRANQCADCAVGRNATKSAPMPTLDSFLGLL